MGIEFDADKDAANLAKRGVSLGDALGLEWDTLLAMEDRRKSYGERRMLGDALMGERLYCVAFTDRSSVRRIISLRKANNREIVRYVEITNAT
ncbi:BrnT family toxin [Thioalkalivibrio thiocyanoxidans]|uniref:BrnT family toxin n=1 Tax=Thioalkalivibrio thiocyanoxidans TaxID=152475 RepID=UPI00038127A7|nr:BrnT family toxin [Thioalkalivibrio thiocyanoxidans]